MTEFGKRWRAGVRILALIGGLSATGFAKKLPAKPIDLNTATLAQLEELPGIGRAKARAILEFREKSGPFEHVTDLLALPGIGRREFERLRPYVYVVRAKKKQKPARKRNAGQAQGSRRSGARLTAGP